MYVRGKKAEVICENSSTCTRLLVLQIVQFLIALTLLLPESTNVRKRKVFFSFLSVLGNFHFQAQVL